MLNNDPIIRLAKKQDIQQLVSLCKEHAVYEKVSYNSLHKKNLLLKHLFPLNDNIKCILIEQNGKLLGYATILKQFSTWDAHFYFYMDCLYLKEEARGKGLGKMMMKELKKYANEKQCNMQWQTPNFNIKAIAFYESIGANHISKERFFWSRGAVI